MNEVLDRRAIQEDLIVKFSQYQYRLDMPMPKATESSETYRLAYMSDPVFRAKVRQIVAAVMHTIDEHAIFMEDTCL